MNPVLPNPVLAPPRKDTPVRLREMLLAVGALAAAAGVVIEFGVYQHRAAEKAVAKEATRSVVAAQQAKAGLAAMHAHAMRALLGRPEAAKDYEASRVEVAGALLMAAQNITYSGEGDQVRALVEAFGRYEGRIAAALALNARAGRDPGGGFAGVVAGARERVEVLREVREADRILREQLFDAADRLDQINDDQLNRLYGDQQSDGQMAQSAVFLVGLLLVGTLVGVQVWLRQRFRRVLSLPLVLATVLAAGFVLFVMAELMLGRGRLKVAKEDAFESVHLMWQARADAHYALAAARLRLFETDPARSAEVGKRFDKTVEELGGNPLVIDPQALAAQIQHREVPHGLGGRLEKALGTVRFTHKGEADALTEAVAAFADFVYKDRVLRTDDPPAAVRLAAGDKGGSLTAAAARLDAALFDVLEINQKEFELATGRGSVVLRWSEYLNPLAMAGVFALTALGLYPRLREYAV